MDTPNIPGYDILAPLPQGGMSAVFKARQLSLDRVVVLKILPPAMAVDGVDIEKLLAEAKITAQLKHPNIVQIYDFGKSPEGIYYFVMEFVSGYSVADWIRRKTSLSVKDTLLCAHCVAEALKYAWGAFGVVHCDIKPDNVMIDGDGTVKVADLGLARSVRSVMDKAKFQAGVVVGTPYYISPEQSQGRLDLDCRTDIYSLGAMLYHCLTGKMPFEGLPPLAIMDCQITDQIPDMIDLQPQASMAVACLIEKMMAKNPDHRQKDWPEVIRDMIRARSAILPQGPLPPEGASTMKRCVAREQYLKEMSAAARRRSAKSDALPAPPQDIAKANLPGEPVQFGVAWLRPWLKPEWLAAVIMLIALAVPSLLVVKMLMKPKPAATPQERRETAGDGRQTTEALAKKEALVAAEPDSAKEEASAQRRLESALQWCRANPLQYNEAIQQFAKIATQAKGTRYAQAAEEEIARIRVQKRAAMAADMKALNDNVQPLLARQKWREAAKLFEQYAGQFKTETEAERKAKVREWLERDKSQQAEISKTVKEQSRQWQNVLNDVSACLVDGNPGAALAVVQQATNNPVLSANRNDLRTLASMLAEAGRADQRLLDSFRMQKDQEVDVVLTRGPEHMVVRDVQDETILVEKIFFVNAGQIGQSKVIRLQDLALEEKKARLGTNATPDTALVHGLLAVREGNLAAAEISWSQAGPYLSAPLKAKLQERKYHQLENQARNDFVLLLRAAQVEVADLYAVSGEALAKTEARAATEPGVAKEAPLPGCEVCLAAIYKKKYPPQTAKVLAKSVAGYQEQYGQTAFAQAYAPALAALKQVPVIALDSNRTAVAESVPAKAGAFTDGADVRKELFLRNPGLTEFNVSFVSDDAGKIVRAELIASDLKDIKPLAGLPDLRAVVCAAIGPGEWSESLVQAPLSDLSPLRGLPLQEVCVSHTRVKDLAPLIGMPLTKLDLTGTRVTDFSVLKNLPLRDLTLSHLSIRDLSPVRGLALEILNVHATRVKDLSPLRDMPLKWLDISDTEVRDLSPIQNAPIEEIWLDFNINQQMSADTYRAFAAILLRMPRLQKINGKSKFQERRRRE